jgi:hypothetical protein
MSSIIFDFKQNYKLCSTKDNRTVKSKHLRNFSHAIVIFIMFQTKYTSPKLDLHKLHGTPTCTPQQELFQTTSTFCKHLLVTATLQLEQTLKTVTQAELVDFYQAVSSLSILQSPEAFVVVRRLWCWRDGFIGCIAISGYVGAAIIFVGIRISQDDGVGLAKQGVGPRCCAIIFEDCRAIRRAPCTSTSLLPLPTVRR